VTATSGDELVPEVNYVKIETASDASAIVRHDRAV